MVNARAPGHVAIELSCKSSESTIGRVQRSLYHAEYIYSISKPPEVCCYQLLRSLLCRSGLSGSPVTREVLGTKTSGHGNSNHEPNPKLENVPPESVYPSLVLVSNNSAPFLFSGKDTF